MRRFAVETKKETAEIAPEALEELVAYDWPGNVRELANVIERAVVLGQGRLITPKDLPAGITEAEPGFASEAGSYRAALDACRRQTILAALKEHQGNRAAAARALGLHEKYLLRVVKHLRIE